LDTVPLPTLVVTHDPLDALALGVQVVVLEAGRISQMWRRGDLLHQPRSAFVAELAGLNVFEVEIAAVTGGAAAAAGPLTFALPGGELPGRAWLALPPSAVTLRSVGKADGPNLFPGTVVDVLPLGDKLRVTADIGLLLRAELPETAAPGGLRRGLGIVVAVDRNAIRVYR